MEGPKSLVCDIPVRMNECAPDGTLRRHVWFDYLQHLAAVHAESLGFGMSAIREKKLIWVLSRLKIHLDGSPRYDDVVRVETYHNGTDRLFAKRQFVLSSAKTGERFGCASSFWLCVEVSAMRPRPPSAALGLNDKDNADREDFFPKLDKLPLPENASDPVVHNIRASHIDLNDHLNNSYYCQYALDWVAKKIGKLVHFSELQINFNRAMQFGEDLVVTGTLDGDAFLIEGKDRESGKNAFQAQGTFRIADGVTLVKLIETEGETSLG